MVCWHDARIEKLIVAYIEGYVDSVLIKQVKNVDVFYAPHDAIEDHYILHFLELQSKLFDGYVKVIRFLKYLFVFTSVHIQRNLFFTRTLTLKKCCTSQSLAVC